MLVLIKNSIDLVVTSPPYPMIDIWDNDLIDKTNINSLNAFPYKLARNLCEELIYFFITNNFKRSLKPGAIICINIGDATRSINKNFALYPNHSFIINNMIENGYTLLPTIIWKKPTNSPNKFMGSGMLPCCAYNTLGHEYVLVFRYGGKRNFNKKESVIRKKSAYFWEERNKWFTDIWEDIYGANQKLKDDNIGRTVSARYPIMLPQRLIKMFTIKGDTVLDPFLGTGTTTHAAIVEGRNSIGIEINKEFKKYIMDINIISDKLSAYSYSYNRKRIIKHLKFIKDSEKEFKYINEFYNFPVLTKQETDIRLEYAHSIKSIGNIIKANYKDIRYTKEEITNIVSTIDGDSDIYKMDKYFYKNWGKLLKFKC